jgi:hypothetical protein
MQPPSVPHRCGAVADPVQVELAGLGGNVLDVWYDFTHETVRDWEARFAPMLSGKLKVKRRGGAGKSWYVDETYIKLQGRWQYLYRAMDRDGNLIWFSRYPSQAAVPQQPHRTRSSCHQATLLLHARFWQCGRGYSLLHGV